MTQNSSLLDQEKENTAGLLQDVEAFMFAMEVKGLKHSKTMKSTNLLKAHLLAYTDLLGSRDVITLEEVEGYHRKISLAFMEIKPQFFAEFAPKILVLPNGHEAEAVIPQPRAQLMFNTMIASTDIWDNSKALFAPLDKAIAAHAANVKYEADQIDCAVEPA